MMLYSMRNFLTLLVVLAATLLSTTITTAFTTGSTSINSRSATAAAAPSSSSTRLNFFGPKDDGSPGDYVCLDCGWVFTKGPKAWADLPSSFSCPPCGSIKRRFKKVAKGSAGK